MNWQQLETAQDPTITICRQCGGFERESVGRWPSPAFCELCKQFKPAEELNICLRLDFKSPAPHFVDDLSMLVARLVRQVRKFHPANDVANKAMEYLARNNLLNASILRTFDQTDNKEPNS